MYRDDVCATCGESLPPDHLYCREHAGQVDDRLRELGRTLPRLLDELARASRLAGELATETYDFVAEQEPDDPVWPPLPTIALRADPEEVDVDVDTEPGMVRVRLEVELPALLQALTAGLDVAELRRFAAACAQAEGANIAY